MTRAWTFAVRSNWMHDASAAEWLAGRAWTFAEWCVVTRYCGLLVAEVPPCE